ncbi:MAG TPA: hypothetical protein VGB30_06085 [bacterium]|jgi:hypothetical protein
MYTKPSSLALYFVLLTAALTLTNCASSRTSDLVNPPLSDTYSLNQTAGEKSRMLWGYFEVTIDPVSLDAEIVPIRGAEFNSNITKFLQPPLSPSNRIDINILPASNLSTGHLLIDMTIIHPFPGLPKFTGFDVRGILIADGSMSGSHDDSLLYHNKYETRLLNPDGYTRWWNPSEFTSYGTMFGFTPGKLAPPVYPTSTLNGYKYFADGLDETESVESLDPESRGTFSTVPGANTRRYDVQLVMKDGFPSYKFNYAIDSSWALPSDDFAPEYPAEAFPVSANLAEPYYMHADFSKTTAYYVDSTSNGGDVVVGLELFDWGAMLSENALRQEIDAIWVESPTLIDEPVDVLSSCSSGIGNGFNSSIFEFEIHDVHPDDILNQTILVTVESSSPNTYRPQVPNGDMFDYPDAALASYMLFDVPISDTVPNVQPEIDNIVPDKAKLNSGDISVTITGNFFADDAIPVLIKSDNPSVEIYGTGMGVGLQGDTIGCNFNTDAINGAEAGEYDLKVTNPGPPALFDIKYDAFEIEPGPSCDEVFRDELYEGEMENHSKEVHSIAFNSDGNLISRQFNGTYNLAEYDVLQDGLSTGNVIVHNMLYGQYSIGDLDVCDVTGNIIYAVCGGGYVDGYNNRIVIYDIEGNFVQEIDNADTNHLQGIDTDDDGSLWTIGHTYKDISNPEELDIRPDKYFIDHYIWTGSEYEYDALGSIEVTSDIKYSDWPNIFDIAVSYSEDLLMVWSYGGSLKGRIDTFDLSPGTPVHINTTENILSHNVGAHGAYNWRAAGDIEIDHSDPDSEHCRILVSARNTWLYGQTFVKVDSDGSVIDEWNNPDADDEDRYFWTHGLLNHPDYPDETFMVATEDFSLYGGTPSHFHTFEMPDGW